MKNKTQKKNRVSSCSHPYNKQKQDKTFRNCYKTFFGECKLLFDIGYSSRFNQIYNIFILIFLSTMINIFVALKQSGEVFMSAFEICVWVFMIIFLTLKAMHHFRMLYGYFMICGSIALMSLLFMKPELIKISIIVCGIFYSIDFIYFRRDWRKR